MSRQALVHMSRQTLLYEYRQALVHMPRQAIVHMSRQAQETHLALVDEARLLDDCLDLLRELIAIEENEPENSKEEKRNAA